MLRGLMLSAALIAFAPDAMAGEPGGVVHKVSCTVVRYYVGKYSVEAAEMWARSHGATEAEIDLARHCLKDMPAKTLQAAAQPATVQ